MEDFFKFIPVVHTTQFVIDEIKEEIQLTKINEFITSRNIRVNTQANLEDIIQIFNECPGLSITDCSILEFAMRTNGIVLSSDKTLRNEIKRRQFSVRGIIWVIEELVKNDIISVECAIDKLTIYSTVNSRAPIGEIQKLQQKLHESINC